MSLNYYYKERISQENKAFRAGRPIDEQGKRADGEFFASIEFICDMVPIPVDASQFPKIQRNQAHGNRIYPTTANDRYLETYSVAESTSSDATNTLQQGTKVDFLLLVMSRTQ
jgi:hypothetical protein